MNEDAKVRILGILEKALCKYRYNEIEYIILSSVYHDEKYNPISIWVSVNREWSWVYLGRTVMFIELRNISTKCSTHIIKV